MVLEKEKVLNIVDGMKNKLKLNIQIVLCNKSLKYYFDLKTIMAKVWDLKQKIGFVIFRSRRLGRKFLFRNDC